MASGVVVNEIYLSLQGESTFAGLPCVFIRTTGCPLRCSYCDTAYAFSEGRRQEQEEVIAEVERLARPYALPVAANWRSPMAGLEPDEDSRRTPVRRYEGTRLPLVELTGGEPLAQPGVLPLMTALCDQDFTVLLETSGALDITAVDPRVHRIVDLKCPASGESERNRWDNLADLRPTDELKFVISSREDYEWAVDRVNEHSLAARCSVLFSWAAPLSGSQRHPALKALPPGQTPISRRELAERIVADALPVRFQVQMHKVIWSPEERGV
ncbi:MAG: 7-carboxy-7-deazaguanine synthase [Verrucomicrobiales bacterium]|nr:7-carboxy-7-deazaguanine synthase [Verrucomicrobiales bacterium]